LTLRLPFDWKVKPSSVTNRQVIPRRKGNGGAFVAGGGIAQRWAGSAEVGQVDSV